MALDPVFILTRLMIFTAFDPVFILIRFEPISLLMKTLLSFSIYIQRDPDGNKFLDFSGYPVIMDVLCNLYTSSHPFHNYMISGNRIIHG